MRVTCEADIRDLPGGTVIGLSGDIDGGAADVLTAAYEGAVADANTYTVVLDFTNVGYIDSTGIALIVSVLARARAERRTVAAAGLSAHYREIFDITRLSDFIGIYPDPERALRQREEPAGGQAGSSSDLADDHDT